MSEQDRPVPEEPQDGSATPSGDTGSAPQAGPPQPEDGTQPIEGGAPQAEAGPQWIPIPQPAAAPPRRAAGGRALAIAAMATGLVALLTAAVSVFYLPPFLWVGVALALGALVLGVVALVKRQRPLPASIVGLVAAGLAVVVALAGGMFAIGTALAPGLAGLAQRDGSGSGGAETAPPGDAAAIDWPANMAHGGIVFGERGDPVRSEPLAAGTAPEPFAVQRDGSRNDVLIYVDYRCPYCAAFEQENGALLEEALASGSTTVQVVPLTFLDAASQGTAYSSRAAGAVACTVDAQPDAAWAVHTALLDPEIQPEEGIPGPSDEELIAELDRAAGGLDDAVADCISERRFTPFASALSGWALANPVPNAAVPDLEVQSTPTVLVNGVLFTGDTSDAAAFRKFYDEQTG